MKLNSAITKKYNDGYVQVEIGAQNREPKCYKVPELKADEFQNEYKTNSKKVRKITTLIMLSAIASAIAPVAYFSKKIQDKTLRSILGIGSGVAGGIGAMLLSNKFEIKNNTTLLQKYNAEEVSSNKD